MQMVKCLTNKCLFSACEDCWELAKNKCFYCKTKAPDSSYVVIPNLPLRHMYAKKLHKCENDRCNFEGLLQETKAHEAVCAWKREKCPNSRCNFFGTAAELRAHENVCELYFCSNCELTQDKRRVLFGCRFLGKKGANHACRYPSIFKMKNSLFKHMYDEIKELVKEECSIVLNDSDSDDDDDYIASMLEELF